MKRSESELNSRYLEIKKELDNLKASGGGGSSNTNSAGGADAKCDCEDTNGRRMEGVIESGGPENPDVLVKANAPKDNRIHQRVSTPEEAIA